MEDLKLTLSIIQESLNLQRSDISNLKDNQVASATSSSSSSSQSNSGLSVTTASPAAGGGSLSVSNGVFTFTPADTSGSGGATSLNSLSDVNTSSVSGSNNILKYNHTNSNWEAVEFNVTDLGDAYTPNGVGAGWVLKYDTGGTNYKLSDNDIGGLTDVDATSASATNILLKYNSTNSNWVAGGLSLNDLSDVSTAAASGTYNLLKYDGSAWGPASLSLNNLSDVNTAPAANNVLLWNGSSWEAADIFSSSFTVGRAVSFNSVSVTNNISAGGTLSSTGNLTVSNGTAVISGSTTANNIRVGDGAFNQYGWDGIRHSSRVNAGDSAYNILMQGAGDVQISGASNGYLNINNQLAACWYTSTYGRTFSVNERDPNRNYAFTVNGTAYISQAGYWSDDRIKFNETNIINGLQVIRQLNPKYYDKVIELKENANATDMNNSNYKTCSISDLNDSNYQTYKLSKECGLIAQDVLKIKELSFCVTGGDRYENNNLIEDLYGVDYNSIFTYNIVATKELDTTVTDLTNKLSIANNKINNLEAENVLIKNALNGVLTQLGKPNI